MNENLRVFDKPDLKEAIQGIRDLLSCNKIAFLLGAGCSKCAGLPLMFELTDAILNHNKISKESKKLLENVKNMFSGASTCTIEDYMSEIVDLISISERRNIRGADNSNVKIGRITCDLQKMKLALTEIQKAIISLISNKEVDISMHQQFVRAIHKTLQAGKKNRYVDYFILNYDTLIEDSLGLEQVLYSDGFSGATTGWWYPKTFDEDGKSTRVFKIHGSIDWCQFENDSIPRRIRPKIKTDSKSNHVLIYPSATKYYETQRDPFSYMLKYMHQILCPEEKSSVVLTICGYSFSDSHINKEIENALILSEGNLTIAAFIEKDIPEGKLKKWLNKPSINEQIRVYSKTGYFHGTNQTNQYNNLPWWKFEVLTRLLRGES